MEAEIGEGVGDVDCAVGVGVAANEIGHRFLATDLDHTKDLAVLIDGAARSRRENVDLPFFVLAEAEQKALERPPLSSQSELEDL